MSDKDNIDKDNLPISSSRSKLLPFLTLAMMAGEGLGKDIFSDGDSRNKERIAQQEKARRRRSKKIRKKRKAQKIARRKNR